MVNRVLWIDTKYEIKLKYKIIKISENCPLNFLTLIILKKKVKGIIFNNHYAPRYSWCQHGKADPVKYWGPDIFIIEDAYLSVVDDCKFSLLRITTSSPTLVAEFATTLGTDGNAWPRISQTLTVTNGCWLEMIIPPSAKVMQTGFSGLSTAKVVKADNKFATPFVVCTERLERR